MTEPTRYSTAAVELPLRIVELEPVPVEGCAGCVELANVRDRARVGGDMTTVTDATCSCGGIPRGTR